MEVGKVRQTAGRAGGKLRAAKIATGPLAHCNRCSPPIISFTPFHSFSFVRWNSSANRQVIDVEDGDDDGQHHNSVAGGDRESLK